MKLLFSFTGNDPYRNIALEYDIFNRLHETGEDIVITYVNHPSVVIGKNQNLFEEVNWLDAHERGIDIVRRDSGGGAVFHDLGNLNYSFMTRDQSRALDFAYFLAPVIDFLAGLGLRVRIEQDSNLMLGTHKISGNAQAVRKDCVMHHGTLLFDSDTGQLKRSLAVVRERIRSRAVKSRESEVVNIRECLSEQGIEMTPEDFRLAFEDFFLRRGYVRAEVDDRQIHDAEEACRDKYRAPQWIFGKSPKFSVVRKVTDAAGDRATVVCLELKHGILTGFTVDTSEPPDKAYWEAVFSHLQNHPVGISEWDELLLPFPDLETEALLHCCFDLSRA